MEDLDSILFRIPDLVDYRVSFRDKFYFHCRFRNPITDTVLDTIEKKLPGLEAEISAESVKREQCPLYPVKRYILTDCAMYELVRFRVVSQGSPKDTLKTK